MDALGDEQPVGDDELAERRTNEHWTPEAQVLTGAGLVLAAMLTIGLFQALSFYIFGGSFSAREQGLMYALPTTLLALAGAVVARTARTAPDSPTLRGLAHASWVVGAVVGLGGAASCVAVLLNDSL